MKKYFIKTSIIIFAVLFFGMLSIGYGNFSNLSASPNTKQKESATQTLCPVLDNPIDKSVFTSYKGNKIYFCCGGCIDDFNQNPEKYLKIVA